MRENQLETPQREHSLINRRSKSVSDHSKKSHKMNRKSLNAEFSAVSGDVSAIELPKDSIALSSISEISDVKLITESPESFPIPLIPAVTPTSETLSFADLTSSSSITTSGNHKESSAQKTHCGNDALELVKITPVETEMLVKELRESMGQVLNSTDVHSRSKKLLDALVNVMVEEFYGLSDDNDWFNQLTSKKAAVVLLSFLLWILSVSAVLFSNSDGQPPSVGGRPT